MLDFLFLSVFFSSFFCCNILTVRLNSKWFKEYAITNWFDWFLLGALDPHETLGKFWVGRSESTLEVLPWNQSSVLAESCTMSLRMMSAAFVFCNNACISAFEFRSTPCFRPFLKEVQMSWVIVCIFKNVDYLFWYRIMYSHFGITLT